MSALEIPTATHLPLLFEFTAEHTALREVLRRFFQADTSDTETGNWQRLLVDVGARDILMGSADGESSSTPVDLAIMAEEAGAALYPGPIVPTAVLGALPTYRSEGNSEQFVPTPQTDSPPSRRAFGRDPHFAQGVSYTALGTSLLGDPRPELTGRNHNGCYRLNGVVEPVWNIEHAGWLICEAMVDGALAVVLLNIGAPGVHMSTLHALDPSRPLGRVECRDAPAESVYTDPAIAVALRRRGDLVIAAELLGVAQCAFDRTIDHVAHRIQFGRTLGSFQAIKHRLADLLTRVELTRSAVYGAAWHLATAPEDIQTDIDLAVAAALAIDTATDVTRAAVQLHGGMAITWEHWAHRYLRRAHATAVLIGGAVRYRRRLADYADLREERR
ncbi:acyl-CoA dehydrogenase family protein [Nocardia sp. NPDC058058]|uniref:acyl-CoA dehydrogenase family protein n=1 Tax=Nocardia sp. NPDC058058 TaxID=3346317 RepID=UPI0036DC98CC